MRGLKIVAVILFLSILIGQIFHRNIEPLQNSKGELYLLLEVSIKKISKYYNLQF